MSESVFVGLCEIVGTSQQVAIRRETEDIREMVKRRATSNDENIQMLSGSKREGFRLEGSDLDSMFWPSNHRVIMYLHIRYTAALLKVDKDRIQDAGYMITNEVNLNPILSCIF